jgi:hypothetical protein
MKKVVHSQEWAHGKKKAFNERYYPATRESGFAGLWKESGVLIKRAVKQDNRHVESSCGA